MIILPMALLIYPYFLSFEHLSLDGRLFVEPESQLDVAIDEVSAERLMFKSTDGMPKRIRSLNDLAGHVRIGSAQAALEFCRIDSNPFIFNIFGKGSFRSEVVKIAHVKSLLLGLDPKHLNWLKLNGYGSGVVTSEAWMQFEFKAPIVRASETGYQIERTLFERVVQSSKVTNRVVVVFEEVDHIGNFTRKTRKVVLVNPYGWQFRSLADSRKGGID